MVCTQNEWKLGAHGLVCDQKIPGPWKLEANKKVLKNDLFYFYYEKFTLNNTNLFLFLQLGTSATIPGRNRGTWSLHSTTTREPTGSSYSCAVLSKAMWRPDETLALVSKTDFVLLPTMLCKNNKENRTHWILKILPFYIRIKSQESASFSLHL